MTDSQEKRISDAIWAVFGGHTMIRTVGVTNDERTLDFISPSKTVSSNQISELLSMLNEETRKAVTRIAFKFPNITDDSTGAWDTSRNMIASLTFCKTTPVISDYAHVEYRTNVPFKVADSRLNKMQIKNLTKIILYVLNMQRDMDAVNVAFEVQSLFDIKLDFEGLSSVDWSFLVKLRERFVGGISSIVLDGQMTANNRMRLLLTTLDFTEVTTPATESKKRQHDDDIETNVDVKRKSFFKSLIGL